MFKAQTEHWRFEAKRKGPHRQAPQRDFVAIAAALANGQPLSEQHRDHAPTGEWKDHRDCHVKPDLVLIYRKLAADVLQLVRLGSHSELGL